MRRFPLFGLLALIPAFALLMMTACSDGKKGADGGKPADGKKDDKSDNKAAEKEKIKAPTDAVIKGTVKLDGDTPKIDEIKALVEFKDAAERAFCMQGDKKDQTWVIDGKGNVANVIVWLELADSKKTFDIKDEHKSPFKKPVVIRQPHCQYVPHIAAVFADIQPLQVESSEGTSHNVKMKETKLNKASDDTQQKKGKAIERTFKYDGAPIVMACSIHTWMQAQVHVFNHPYFAVTKDDGTFEIANVPSGEDLVVYMWHESKGKWKEKDSYKAAKGDNSLDLKIKAK